MHAGRWVGGAGKMKKRIAKSLFRVHADPFARVSLPLHLEQVSAC